MCRNIGYSLHDGNSNGNHAKIIFYQSLYFHSNIIFGNYVTNIYSSCDGTYIRNFEKKTFSINIYAENLFTLINGLMSSSVGHQPVLYELFSENPFIQDEAEICLSSILRSTLQLSVPSAITKTNV